MWVQLLSSYQIRYSYYCWLQLKWHSEGFGKQCLHTNTTVWLSVHILLIKIIMLIVFMWCIYMCKILPWVPLQSTSINADVTNFQFSFFYKPAYQSTRFPCCVCAFSRVSLRQDAQGQSGNISATWNSDRSLIFVKITCFYLTIVWILNLIV